MIRSSIFLIMLFLMSCIKKECQDPIIPDVKPSSITYGNIPDSPLPITVVMKNPIYTSDAYLAEFYPDNNYGLNSKLFCSAWTYSSTPAKVLYLLRFDYSAIPQGKIITSAKLSLFADTTNIYIGSPDPVRGHYGIDLNWSIKRITSSWSESNVTYNTKPSSSLVNKVGLSTPLTNFSSFTEIDVTDLVKDQLVTNNFGFEISLDDPIPYKRLAFYSSEAPQVNSIPILTIEYK